MKKNNIRLVCFDLDKTLIEGNTWQVLNHTLGMTYEEDDYYLQKYNKGEINYYEWTNIVLDFYKKRGMANLSVISNVISKYKFKKGSKEVVNYLKKQGYYVVIVSGAMDILVDKVAKELNVNAAEATNKFIFNDKEELIDILVSGDDKDIKLHLLKCVCNLKKIVLTQCACIGDGDNDIKMFNQTKHGITFTGSRIESSAWKVINTLSAVKHIL